MRWKKKKIELILKEKKTNLFKLKRKVKRANLLNFWKL